MLMNRFGTTLVVSKSVFCYKRPFNRKFVDVSFLKSSRRVASSGRLRVRFALHVVGVDDCSNGHIYSQTGITKFSSELMSYIKLGSSEGIV